MNSVVCQWVLEENRNKTCSLLFWGLNEVPIKDTESLISDLLMHGLSFDSGNSPSFSVVQCSKKF